MGQERFFLFFFFFFHLRLGRSSGLVVFAVPWMPLKKNKWIKGLKMFTGSWVHGFFWGGLCVVFCCVFVGGGGGGGGGGRLLLAVTFLQKFSANYWMVIHSYHLLSCIPGLFDLFLSVGLVSNCLLLLCHCSCCLSSFMHWSCFELFTSCLPLLLLSVHF